jgi:ATP-dependent Zn protease
MCTAFDCSHAHTCLPTYLPTTAGFSGAELSNVVNEAAFLAARSSGEAVGLPELVEAVQRTRWVPGH